MNFDEFLETCPADNDVDRALWLFEHGAPLPEVSPDTMRMYGMQNADTDVKRYYFVTLLRAIETNEPVGVHVLRPFKDAAPDCFFGGVSINTYAEVPGGACQFFIEPETDLTAALINTPSFTRADFQAGTCPPLVPYLTTVWTRKAVGAPLSRPMISAWERPREVAA